MAASQSEPTQVMTSVNPLGQKRSRNRATIKELTWNQKRAMNRVFQEVPAGIASMALWNMK